MRKIVHLPDSSFYTELISVLDFDDDTLIYNELTDEMFRFVLPIDVDQTFDSWKGNLPKYSYTHRGNITSSTGFGDLSASYGSYDTDAIFSSELAPYFMFDLAVYWQKKIGGSGSEYGEGGIALDGNNNIYVNGWQDSDSHGGFDYGVVKLDNDGNILWQKKIGGSTNDWAGGIAVDSSGNVYLNGYQHSDTYGAYYNYGVIKLSNNGNIVYQKKIEFGRNNNLSSSGSSIAVDSSGQAYLNGYFYSESNGSEYGVIKLATNGNVLWNKAIGGFEDDYGNGIAVDGSGNVYVTGYQESDSFGGDDYGVIKLDTNGNLLWQKKIGRSGADVGRGIAVDGSGNVYLNGYQSSDRYGGDDYGVIKLDTNGNLLWQKKIGGTGNDQGYAIAVDGSGNVYLTGVYVFRTYNRISYYGVIKLDSNGNEVWQKKIGGGSYDQGHGIAVDGSGNVYLNGWQDSDSFGGYDYGVMKLYTDQESDMSMSIGDMNLSIGNMSLTISNALTTSGNMNFSIDNMNLSIDDIDISGKTGDLVYIG